MHTRLRPLVASASLGLLFACGTPPADLVLQHGTVVTLDDERPDAQALAIRGQRIVAVGSDEDIGAYIGPTTEVIDLEGRLTIPGFIEGHGHFMSFGRSLTVLDLTTASTWDDIVARVAAQVAQTAPGEWIFGRGWHQEKWTRAPSPRVEGMPLHEALSRVSPVNPVYLTHASGHASFANAAALAAAGIDRDTPDPAGGNILRDAAGEPTGALRENAQDLVEAVIDTSESERPPESVDARRRHMAALAFQEALANGVTSFHDAGASFATIDFYKTLADEGNVPVRLYVMVRGATNDEMAERLPQYRLIGYGDHYLTVRSIKRQIDGALGSYGAWLLEPYDDLPTSTGLVLEPIEDIERSAELAIQHGFQLNVHAIGDRGNRETLDLFQRAFEAHPDRGDLRWRIEHAQHLHPDDIPRFAELGVIAEVQGIHCTSDGPWVPGKLGARRAAEGAYVWRALTQSGAVVGNGTDVPVERVDPIASYYASVSRMMLNGERFYPEQRMDRMEALQSYTVNNAYAAFEEDLKGRLRPGMLADITVLSQNILTVPEEQIPATEVAMTIVGGVVRYRR